MEVSERRMRYKIDGDVSKPKGTAVDLRLLALYAETASLVGVDEPRDELIWLIADEEDASAQELKVLSIVGFGVLGKTTLARQIYGKLERQFQRRAFVSVSQKPNIRQILRTILSQVGYVSPEETNMEMWDDAEFISTLQELLRDKRYFIVIDDIWDADAWNVINCALPKNSNNSVVITTTRIDSVARLCCSNHFDYLYKMKPLSNQDSRRLFFTRIFGSEDACPLFLETVSVKILKRCGGLPLAIITISSILACQRNKLKEKWERILNSLASNIELNPTLEEDCIIVKKDLVWQWIAQGFISKAHGQDQEDVAEAYFNELVNRSIIQPICCTGEPQLVGVEARRMEALRTSIGKLCNLKCLNVVPPCLGKDYSEFHDAMSSVSPSPCRLQRLHFIVLLASAGSRVDSDHRDLHSLDLSIQELLQDDVGILAQLPSLIYLRLHIEGIPIEKVVISRMGFPALEYLMLGCSRASLLTFEAGAMPKLQWLNIYFYAKLWCKYGGAPTGIEHLSGLKEIYVRIGNSDDDSDTRAAESALRSAIDMHPGCPVAEICCSDLRYYFNEAQDLKGENVNRNT